MTNALAQIKNFVQKQTYLVSIFIISFVAGLTLFFEKPLEPAPAPGKKPLSADTYIPAGHVLVPVEVQNADALNSLLGNFGLVDLYRPPQRDRDKPLLVARQVKILRAPLNPNRFAVLVPDAQAPQLVQGDQAFFVIVQNPKNTSSAIKLAARPTSRITFAEEP